MFATRENDMKNKNNIRIIIIGAIAALITTICFLVKKNSESEKKLSDAMNNQKAYISENTLLKNSNNAFRFTVEQLNYYNDSLINRMNEIRKELNIKDKNLKSLQYIASTASKTDTIVFRDTLFKDNFVMRDTVISDGWYTIKLGLYYPNDIVINPTFKSQEYIMLNTRKETVNPPRKFFLFRWFQKKHIVVDVNVVNENPYIDIDQQRFIEIIE